MEEAHRVARVAKDVVPPKAQGVSKEILSALAGAVVLEIGKQTVGAAGGMAGEYVLKRVIHNTKKIAVELKDEGEDLLKDVKGFLSPKEVLERHDERRGKRDIEPKLEQKDGEQGDVLEVKVERSRRVRRRGVSAHGERHPAREQPQRPRTSHATREHRNISNAAEPAMSRAHWHSHRHTSPHHRHHLAADDIKAALRIDQRILDAQAQAALESRTSKQVREGQDGVDMFSKLHRIYAFTNSSTSQILLINGNDPRYTGSSISIFSHLIERKYVSLKYEAKIPAIRLYTGMYRDFAGATCSSPVESMLRNLCFQMVSKYPITGINVAPDPHHFLNAIRHFKLEALCDLFEALCLQYSRLAPKDSKHKLTVLIDGGSLFELHVHEDPVQKHEAFKQAFKAMTAAVQTQQDMGNRLCVLKILIVFPGRPCDVPERKGIVGVLTLPRKFGLGDGIEIPRH